MEAQSRGFAEALMLNSAGDFTEGTNCNVFFGTHSGTLVTPDIQSGLLPGITRQVLLDLARQGGMTVEERPVHREELPNFREAFLASSTRTVDPLASIDDWRLAVPGPLTQQLIALFVERYGEL
jgi:branched-subunit amino acid aminotransferase/4-amino-4-deoxychorismate lyase